ncbi:MAG TPA: carboxypeptidase regulatory-like domain-containing protein, partial [Acidobacteria bacterium]|nr:carboxypeptidase regulatory-like domain-containing protein [Acidobacteriota bacterium]
RSGADGYFRIDDLDRQATVDLSVSRSGYAATTVRGIEVARGEPLEVTLEPSSTLEGRVVGTDGEGIAGAEVELTRTVTMRMGGNAMMMKSVINATGDADGRFVFEELEPGKVSLAAWAPGYEKSSLNDIEVPRGEDVRGIEIPIEEGAVITGRVLLADSRPAIGARVRPVSETPDMAPVGGARSDGDGRYLLDGLGPGVVGIEARLDDGARTVREVEVRRGINQVDLHFSGGVNVQGRVVDEADAPLAGAWVQLAPAAHPWGGPERVTREDGSFDFEGVATGTYRVRASREGYASAAQAPTIEVGAEGASGVEVVLRRGGVIEGQVEGIADSRYPEVHVRAFIDAGEGSASAGLDHEGRFRLVDLAGGGWTVVARLDAEGRRTTARAQVDPAGPPAQVLMEFGQGLTLEGVVRIAGKPLADAIVNLQGRDVAAMGWSRTDSAGRFRVADLDPGHYDLEVRDWSTGLTHLEVVEVLADRDMEIEIPSVSVTGRIVDAQDREPLAGVRVTLVPAGTNDAETLSLGAYAATTDLDGRFRISHVTDGSWLLRTQRKGYAATSELVTIQGGRDPDPRELAIEATEGVVLDLVLPSGVYPESARVAVLDAAGNSVLAGAYPTSEKGRLRLGGVPAGQWLILVATPATGIAQVQVAAPGPPLAVRLPEATSLEINVPELAGESTLATLTIRDGSGRPFRTLGWLGDPVASWRVASGRARLDSLPPGPWTVQVRTADGRQWSATAVTR